MFASASDGRTKLSQSRRKVLDHATEVAEVELGGVDAYRLSVPGPVPHIAYLRRSDRLPIRIVVKGE